MQDLNEIQELNEVEIQEVTGGIDSISRVDVPVTNPQIEWLYEELLETYGS